jgi:hypothetical protein
MQRCAAFSIIAAYVQVRLTPQDLCALPAELFTQPSLSAHFLAFYWFGKIA